MKLTLRMQSSNINAKGFTLIELLVVIAIVAILSVVVILTLNPAQLLAQARDSNRISDMGTLKSAISLYLSDQGSPVLGTANNCYVHASSSVVSSGCGSRYTVATTVSTLNASTSVVVNGSGWIPVNFSAITSGSPVSALPKDPVNSSLYFYSYATDNSSFELDSHMESTKYKNGGGSADVESTDGGSSSTIYEVGTSLSL